MKKYIFATAAVCVSLMLAASYTPTGRGQVITVEHARLQLKPTEELSHKPATKFESLGDFTVTWYCACEKCCGKLPDNPAYGITASGTNVTAGRTAAADWDVLPVGTKIYIEGIGTRTIEDKGGAIIGNHIDVYTESHEEARQNGKQMLEVYRREDTNGRQSNKTTRSNDKGTSKPVRGTCSMYNTKSNRVQAAI